MRLAIVHVNLLRLSHCLSYDSISWHERMHQNAESRSALQPGEIYAEQKKKKVFAFTCCQGSFRCCCLITLIRYSPCIFQLYSLICEHLKADKMFLYCPIPRRLKHFKELGTVMKRLHDATEN